MPGENIHDWSTTASSNATADSSINWAEGQTRASVNNSSRSEMAAHAKHRNHRNGSLTASGVVNFYTVTEPVGYTSLPTGLRLLVKIGPALTNTSTSSLNVNSIGAVTILSNLGIALTGGELYAGSYADLLYNGTNWILTTGSGAGGTVPQRSVLTGGSGTYTTPSAALWLDVEMVGGGGGGGGGASGGAGSDGGNTTFGSLTAGGGHGGTYGGSGNQGATGFGGTASGGDVNIDGANGSYNAHIGDPTVLFGSGTEGASSFFGGAGMAIYLGSGGNAKTNSGSGGGGGSVSALGYSAGGQGGGAGAYVRKLITNPSTTYSYSVGTGGAAGSLGASSYAGGTGAAGIIIITAHFT